MRAKRAKRARARSRVVAAAAAGAVVCRARKLAGCMLR
jgi:hypothetical protein